MRKKSKYSRLPHNAYPLRDSPGYELWGVMCYEGTILVWNMGLVAAKIMCYKGVCIMRGMGYEGVDCSENWTLETTMMDIFNQQIMILWQIQIYHYDNHGFKEKERRPRHQCRSNKLRSIAATLRYLVWSHPGTYHTTLSIAWCNVT